MSPVEVVEVATLRRQYPHVDTVTDFSTQQSLKLLWDRVFSLQEQVTAAQATIDDLIAGHNANERALLVAARNAREALAQNQLSTPGAVTPGGPGDDDDLPGGGDGGDGQAGFNAGLPSGHGGSTGLTAIHAGQLVGGTMNEHAALRNPTLTIGERLTNAENLLRRVIWHLQLAGFTSGRQKNPSGLISQDKITVVVDGVLRAYDIFIDLSNFAIQLKGHMGEVGPPKMVGDAGIPD
jgi:hypothetical protein